MRIVTVELIQVVFFYRILSIDYYIFKFMIDYFYRDAYEFFVKSIGHLS